MESCSRDEIGHRLSLFFIRFSYWRPQDVGIIPLCREKCRIHYRKCRYAIYKIVRKVNEMWKSDRLSPWIIAPVTLSIFSLCWYFIIILINIHKNKCQSWFKPFCFRSSNEFQICSWKIRLSKKKKSCNKYSSEISFLIFFPKLKWYT